jgi:hypothetical protein
MSAYMYVYYCSSLFWSEHSNTIVFANHNVILSYLNFLNTQ